eukprot:CAMPEP_0119519930 /NCGR_PEP_ID=MMETSP1344-20130328/36080_1 /TAXON_ID=236787 /ORGANISM="Florenciella parvula, Strain CCMP2471" /LENGTH=164 /DNA_ID=CAMNT_0007557761 /DNA_START=176 /DNA_END=667 /DNA_ORIENTATION=-
MVIGEAQQFMQGGLRGYFSHWFNYVDVMLIGLLATYLVLRCVADNEEQDTTAICIYAAFSSTGDSGLAGNDENSTNIGDDGDSDSGWVCMSRQWKLYIIRYCLGFAAIPLLVRLLEAGVLSREIGPMVQVMQNVVKEVLSFLLIILVFITSFSVTSTILFSEPE